MLMPLFVILLVMWLLGMVSSYTLGGFIHILLLGDYSGPEIVAMHVPFRL